MKAISIHDIFCSVPIYCLSKNRNKEKINCCLIVKKIIEQRTKIISLLNSEIKKQLNMSNWIFLYKSILQKCINIKYNAVDKKRYINSP
jgi:hypothetical protein